MTSSARETYESIKDSLGNLEDSLDALAYSFELLATKLQVVLDLQTDPDDSVWWQKDKRT